MLDCIKTFIKKILLLQCYFCSVRGRGKRSYENWITTRTLRDDQGNKVLGENGYSMKEVLITKAEQAELEQQAKDFLKGVKINLFLTKNSSDLFEFE